MDRLQSQQSSSPTNKYQLLASKEHRKLARESLGTKAPDYQWKQTEDKRLR